MKTPRFCSWARLSDKTARSCWAFIELPNWRSPFWEFWSISMASIYMHFADVVTIQEQTNSIHFFMLRNRWKTCQMSHLPSELFSNAQRSLVPWEYHQKLHSWNLLISPPDFQNIRIAPWICCNVLLTYILLSVWPFGCVPSRFHLDTLRSGLSGPRAAKPLALEMPQGIPLAFFDRYFLFTKLSDIQPLSHAIILYPIKRCW